MPLNIERSRTTNGSISGLPRKGKIRAILNNGSVSNLDHAATIQQTMIFHQRFLPGLAIASYLVGDEKTRECAVVDASSGLSATCQGGWLRVRHILEKHVHSDFVSGAGELKACLGD
jgi:hypothetical protein